MINTAGVKTRMGMVKSDASAVTRALSLALSRLNSGEALPEHFEHELAVDLATLIKSAEGLLGRLDLG